MGPGLQPKSRIKFDVILVIPGILCTTDEDIVPIFRKRRKKKTDFLLLLECVVYFD